MPCCDLCGKPSDLVDAIIEGSRVSVCGNCSKFGKVVYLKKPRYENKPKKKLIIKKPEIIEVVVPNYAYLIKQARESLGLEQKKIARMIGIKESLLHKIESSHVKPSVPLSKKFQKFFKIKLIEIYEEKANAKEITLDNTALTIGDLIKLKK